MKLRLLAPLALAISAHILFAENEIGFIEKFALAPDREVVLSQLIPGSEEFYFFHALHYQNSAQAPKLATTLDEWTKRFPNSETRRIIENRAALLAYETDPQATLKYLREKLGLQFNHVQEVRDQKPNLPAALDAAQVARGVFLAQALADDGLGSVAEGELETLVREKVALRPPQRRALLARIKRPDVPNLVEMIADELNSKESRGFGEFPIHTALLPAQLDALAKLVPRIATESPFVFAKLRKLAPGADADVEFDPVEREAWLDRAWAYVKGLPAPFNSLKAHILYHRLTHDHARGVHDEARFKEYLLLPRQTDYMNPKWLEKQRGNTVWTDLNADFGETRLGFAPVRNDEALVRDYFLEIIARNAAQAVVLDPKEVGREWFEMVRDTWLRPVIAESLLTHGIGAPEKWASLLTPTAFQGLKERVDVEFAPTNAPFVAPDEAVSVDVFLKNTPKVIVKIYELNALSFFLMQKRQLNTDVNLDGLVANTERTQGFDDAAGRSPFQRVVRNFKFPELKGRGVWVVEFIGGGKSSRALVRKGQWTVLQQTGAAGDLLTVLDENRVPVRDAVIWADGRKYEPLPVAENANGKPGKLADPQILVPFTTQPGRKPIVLSDAAGKFATLAEFEHHGEEYHLNVQFHIEREQLLGRREASLAVRATMLLGATPIPLDLLKESKMRITSTSLDGVKTTSEVKGLKLESGRELIHSFSVPERLATLTVTVTGQVEQIAQGGAKREVTASRTWELNGIDRTEFTSDAHLSKMGENHVFELLGKNGEALPDQQVVFRLTHWGFTGHQTIALRTDELGRVNLGKLPGILSIDAQIPNGRHGHWELNDYVRTWPTTIHAKVGDVIRVPWAGEAPPDSYSLLELRGGEFVADFSKQVNVDAKERAPAFLPIAGLPAGDYSLRFRDGNKHDGAWREVTIRVTEGVAVRQWLLGKNRSLELRDASPLNVTDVAVTDEGVAIQLANANAFTRVHVAATRFYPQGGLFAGLGGFTRFAPTWGTPDKLPNLFSAGREIGDEFRYILERRFAQKFAGNMLTRPGLLLNPWEKRSTDLNETGMAAGQVATATRGERAGNAPAAPAPMKPAAMSVEPGSQGPNLDFLASAAPVVYNLAPDEKGVVVVPRKLLGDRQYVQVYAEDLSNAVWTTFALAEQGTKFSDLRLTRNLDPTKPFTEKKEVTVLAAGQSLTLADVATSELETYDSLRGIYSLLTTLSGDANLAKFAWVLDWPTLKEEEKRAKYSEFACHELNFFLFRKDAAFFAKVVQPYLRNKKDKTFMDDYLIGADLKRYTDAWAYERLNVVERALLAQRLPGEAARTARHLREMWELLRPDAERTDQLFETALRGRALDQAGAGDGFKQAKEETLKEMAAAAAPTPARKGGAMGGGVVSSFAGRAKDMPEIATSGRAALADGALYARGSLKAADARESSGEKLDRLQELEKKSADKSVRLRRADGENRFGVDAKFEGVNEFDFAEVKALGLVTMDVAEQQRGLARERAYYRRIGPTKEWAENNYYHLPIQEQDGDLVSINAFWRDYGAWDGKSTFVSANVTEASRNFTEMMFALAVLDLPFEAAKHTTKADNTGYTLTAAGPILAFHKEIKSAAEAKGDAELLVSQNFYRHGDRYREEGNEKFDKYVTAEFLAGAVYGGNIVVTNPASSPQKLSLLLQIPQGALPVLGTKTTQSRQLRLDPYTTQTFEYFFYFPSAAPQPFLHYPVQVARNESIVGSAKPFTFNAVTKLSQVDKASWDYVSQYGSDADVWAFLEQANIERLNLERIAWRARQNVEFFRKLIAVMEARHIYNDTLYGYSVVHNEAPALREWLRHRDEFLSRCGAWLDCKLVTIDPVERRAYEHLEYSPLVNQRAHRLGAETRIANPVIRSQYQTLLQILAHKPKFDDADNMSVVYFLFLQDRVEEALARFKTVSVAALPTKVQHDYFRCYSAFYEEKTVEARALAAQYADYPVDRWRALFGEVTAQIDEIEGKKVARAGDKPDRENQQSELAATEPTFSFKVENKTVTLTWKNLPSVTMNYYLMDPEFLFSASPFVTEDSGRFSIIKPTKSVVHTLPEGKDTIEVALPGEFTKANVLVEIIGAGQRRAQAYHANTLKLNLAENYGRLEIRDQVADKPVGKVYVKVYARLGNGTVRFFKDGYTDLRGRFDYTSLNSSEKPTPNMPAARTAGGALDYQMLGPSELGNVERFAILVLSETHGAAVREAQPPQE